MATIEVKNKDGKAVGKVDVSAAILAANPSMDTVHRAVVAEEANKRQGTQSAKTRSEVRGGGRKPYKQKKTGNARQGTIRAPHYAHGGMALAVKPRDYTKGINKRERRQAILGALHEKVINGSLIAVDAVTFTAPKTKDATNFLKALGLGEARRVLIILPEYDEVTTKCFRNLPNVEVRTAPSKDAAAKTQAFSARDVLVATQVVVAKDAMTRIQEVWG
ncbi:MAG: 50S ribosomal protein L4 [Armatimonadetes bacterium]|nr:50S ribosomal protein L4 [Armatimonadota bacterium]